MNIGNFKINEESKCFIIAELSANHNSDKSIAIETIKAAKRAGANCIKLQTYTPDTLTIKSSKKDFIINSNSIWDGQTYYDLYESAYTPWEWHEDLFKVAHEEGLICFSSPFDKSAVDFLEKLNCPAYKIASFEITDIPLIEYVASKMKPIIISTGIATKDDIEKAIEACKRVGNKNIALLKCTSSYPAPIEEANLAMIKEFKDKYNVISGLSDHTLGFTVPVVAVSLGAKIIEKHFILNKNIGGPDASFSLDEEEFKLMVRYVRETEKSIGNTDFKLTEKQKEGRKFSRSLYIVKDVKKNDIITHENLRSIRPGYGIHPENLEKLIGKKFNTTLSKGTRMDYKYVEN